ncbi:MAG TPA: hypothetical protein VI197_15370 [Polyangiaceae bacterium]
MRSGHLPNHADRVVLLAGIALRRGSGRVPSVATAGRRSVLISIQARDSKQPPHRSTATLN